MFNKHSKSLVFLILTLLLGYSGYSQKNLIIDDTWSFRVNADGSVLHTDWAIRGTYYGYPSGARTSFDSSPFLEFSYHETSASKPDHVDNNTHKLNFRIKFPEDYDSLDTSKKYPMMVFMHGAGERGNCWGNNCYQTSDPKNYYNNDHQLYHGGQKHLLANQTKLFDGFILYPQNRNSWFWPDRFEVADLVDVLIESLNIDDTRIYIHGLSNGGNATWQMISYRPDLFAAAVSESGRPAFQVGADPTGDLADPEKMLHIPTWAFQGSNDRNPTPAYTESNLDFLRSFGGTPEYTLLQGVGHGTWNIAYSWGEDNVRTNSIDVNKNQFFPWFLQYSKLTIHPYFGNTEVCEGDPVNIRMGISPGFDDYEWKKIKNGVETPYASVSGKPHEIIADEVAEYAVRYLRRGEWTQWSDPLAITSKPRPEVVIEASGSTYFPSPDNANHVILSTEHVAQSYQWYRDGAAITSNGNGTNLYVDQNTTGKYHLILSEDGNCNSFPSNPIYVRKEPYTSTPTKPTGFQALADTEKSIILTWDDVVDDTGYELFRSETSGGPYTFVARLKKDAIYYKDNFLAGNTTYYYILRSFNNSGASANTSEINATTAVDSDPPSSPTLTFRGFRYIEQRSDPNLNNEAEEYFDTDLSVAKLTWNASTDNAGISEYRVYNSQGQLLGTTTDTYFEAGGLVEERNYQFYVTAVDLSGNVSSPSNVLNINTVMNGLYFHLYAGGTWNYVDDFSVDSYWYEQGNADNFDISAKNDYYGDGDYFAMDFFGFIYIENEGNHTFYTRSDDGSQLFIDGTKVVNNDGRHGATERNGSIYLTEGPHMITVKFFEATGGQTLEVRWDPPGSGKQLIPNSVLRSYDVYSTPSAPPSPSNLAVSQTAVEPDPNTVFGLDLSWDHSEQTDVVVLGSSTAAGTGASTTANSWVGQFTSWLQNINSQNTVTNLAVGGYTSYHIREDGYSPGGGRPNPDTDHNITQALSVPGVDVIIVNLPSNDIASGFADSETMDNLTAIRAIAQAAGVQIFFTTTQPRTEFVESKRIQLSDKAQLIRDEFQEYTIDIFDELTDFSDYSIKSEYRYQYDAIHLNDAGHTYIFTEVVNTITPYLTRFEVYRGETSGGAKSIITTTLNRSYQDLDLDPSTTFYYEVKAINPYGTSGATSVVSGTTVSDTSSPTQPTNLTVLSYNETSVAISWDSSLDNVGVLGYTIYVDGAMAQQNMAGARSDGSTSSKKSTSTSTAKVEGVISTSALITGLNPGTNYEFTVQAFDESSNNSLLSDPINQETKSSPLPVELVDFSYEKIDNTVLLTWTTASELNNDYFLIERRVGNNDFEAIGKVDGNGTTTQVKNYGFTDSRPSSNNIYRLKQVDYDGQFEYSNIINVVFDWASDWTVFPNPSTADNVNILIRNSEGDTTVKLMLIDVFGRTVYQSEVEVDRQSTFSYQLDLPKDLSKGIYNLIYTTSGYQMNKKLVLK